MLIYKWIQMDTNYTNVRICIISSIRLICMDLYIGITHKI